MATPETPMHQICNQFEPTHTHKSGVCVLSIGLRRTHVHHLITQQPPLSPSFIVRPVLCVRLIRCTHTQTHTSLGRLRPRWPRFSRSQCSRTHAPALICGCLHTAQPNLNYHHHVVRACGDVCVCVECTAKWAATTPHL